jgi:hypothetical protein
VGELAANPATCAVGVDQYFGELELEMVEVCEL